MNELAGKQVTVRTSDGRDYLGKLARVGDPIHLETPEGPIYLFQRWVVAVIGTPAADAPPAETSLLDRWRQKMPQGNGPR